jgi:biopolymer transport protein ExbD
MSHGGGGEGNVCEPNLTPLLDVVLQLLMFFMMCVNFVTEQVNEDVKLPESQSATPMDKADVDVLFINLKQFSSTEFRDRVAPEKLALLQDRFREGDPVVQVVGKDPMKIGDLKYWLKGQYEDAEKTSKDGKVKTAIIIRADKMANYAQVFQILHMCKVQGYTQLKLRAYTKSQRVT